jgi:hypothetical protein
MQGGFIRPETDGRRGSDSVEGDSHFNEGGCDPRPLMKCQESDATALIV